jgi:hypothetical protein
MVASPVTPKVEDRVVAPVTPKVEASEVAPEIAVLPETSNVELALALPFPTPNLPLTDAKKVWSVPSLESPN